MPRRKPHPQSASRSWDAVADWYAGWSGPSGSEHHRRLAVPALLDLLALAPGEHLLDVGCGPGVLAPHAARAGARYTGVDASRRLIAVARRRHSAHGRFLVGDATRLAEHADLAPAAFDAAAFLLSIQDIDPLAPALAGAAWAVRRGGRVALLMTHPCFRVPRQSGWGHDPRRRLRFRRVDRYLTPLAVPMKAYPDGGGATRSYHRPLADYVNGLAEGGLLVDRVLEIATYQSGLAGSDGRAERLSNAEIPLFLGLRAVRPVSAGR